MYMTLMIVTNMMNIRARWGNLPTSESYTESWNDAFGYGLSCHVVLCYDMRLVESIYG